MRNADTPQAEAAMHQDLAARANGGRSTSELRSDIERHRDNLDRTLSALENKLSPGELLDEGLAYVKSGPGEWALKLGRSAKDNPVPTLLTGIGLAWLMLSDRHRERDATPDRRHRDDADVDVDELYAAYLLQEYTFAPDEVECIIYDDIGPEAASRYRSRTSGEDSAGKAGGLRERGADAAGHARDKLGQTRESLQQGAEEIAEGARLRVAQARANMAAASDEVRERVAMARKHAWRNARQAGAAAAHRTREVTHRAGELVERYPLSVMALGVAAGAALGTTLPETRREHELMGEASDDLKKRARSRYEAEKARAVDSAAAARDAALEKARAEGLTAKGVEARGGQVREKVERVTEAARAESERQNLTGEAAREEVDEAKEKVKRVAQAARDAASEKARQQ
jgi:ElaB/YqjD/DUF883 family membrane-anchored ribosome-binding protein